MEQHVYLVTVRTYNYTAEASNLTNNPRGYNHVLYKKLSPQILEGFMHSSRYTRNNQTNKKKVGVGSRSSHKESEGSSC